MRAALVLEDAGMPRSKAMHVRPGGPAPPTGPNAPLLLMQVSKRGACV